MKPLLVTKGTPCSVNCTVPLSTELGYFLNKGKPVVLDLAEPPATMAGKVQRGASLIEQRLPADWRWELDTDKPYERVDGLATITASNGDSAQIAIQVKASVMGRDIANIRAQFEGLLVGLGDAVPLVMARFLSKPVQDRLRAAGISYVDMTGNIYVSATTLALFISDRGSDADPWRGPGRPLGTLKGEPAAKIVRTLADFPGSWTVRELVGEAETSTGSTYRVVDFLEREGLLSRDEAGRILVIDWPAMLRRWSSDYTFAETNQVTRWIAPRGLDQLSQVMADTNPDDKYAVTGTIAAAQWAPYAPARMAMIYAANPDDAAAKWGLRAADVGANVILGQPKFDTVFKRSRTNDAGVVMVAASQVVVDLMTGPGRSPSEAAELLTWMQTNEVAWRRER